MVGAEFDGHTLVASERPGFCNWLYDTQELQGRFAWLVEGLEFDVEHNNLWLESWGTRPRTKTKRKTTIREQMQNAPKLIPVFAHRYLVGQSTGVATNPVLSVQGSEIIVYGRDLRSYLLDEFSSLLPTSHSGGLRNEDPDSVGDGWYERVVLSIPFWGDIISH